MSSTPGKILIIDDDQDLQNIYTEVLKNAGYKVDVALDGQEGYSKILQGGYDLILLDVMMPKIDGLSILKKLKTNPPQIYNGPIIILSVLNNSEIIHTAMENGAKGYIIKSNINPNELLTQVSQILQTA